jgi:4-amino-4-deoxy-L-arabinose transferase-like glycosyltransferase
MRPLLLFSFVLMICWTLAVPIFEAQDEPAHWQYARHIHDHWRLPVYGPGFVEANSPPLYYLAIAALANGSEEPPPLALETARGTLLMLAPPRLYQNSFDDLKWYWPIRAARLVSVVLSSATIWFCFLAGVAATGRHATGLLAAGLVAFLPQFTFRGTNVSNDALVTMWAAATVYLIILLVQRGFTWTRGLTIAAVIAAAFLSKVTAIFLPVPVGLAIISERGVPLVRRIRHLAILLLALVLVLPWMGRNHLLYGDPLAKAAMESAVAPLIVKKSISSAYFLDAFPSRLARSFVGMFGWMNVPLPLLIYLLFGLLGGIALIGCAAALRRGTVSAGMPLRSIASARRLLILASIPVLNFLLVVGINLMFDQPQGRYLFPALPALGVLAAIGLEGALTWNRRRAALFVGTSRC